MDKKLLSILGIIVVAIAVATGAYFYMQQEDESQPGDNTGTNTPIENGNDGNQNDGTAIDPGTYTSEKDVTVIVSTPVRGGVVASPLQVAGQVPGTWSHEAEFVIRLLDSNSATLAEVPATLSGDWMTESMVDFTASLTFEAPETGSMGLLVLEKANPSGLEENGDSVTIPIQF